LALDWYRERENPRLDVRVQRLDTLLREHGISRVRLWKLDVEGSEAVVLHGAAGYLANRAIDAILVEVAPRR
jgi:FkbM family methyltransferase